jgi:hypothetical protein
MDESLFAEIVNALSVDDVGVCVRAAERLHRESTSEDVPRLLQLLHSDDFFVREAAAWPLVETAGPAVLKELLVAYQRGFDDGHDNDGFTAALLELPFLASIATWKAASTLSVTAEEPMKGHAEWLLTFCEAPPAAAKSV